MNGAMPVPVDTYRWVRSSSGSSMNLPLGPIIRIRCPTGSRHSAVVNRITGTWRTNSSYPSLFATEGADATEYGRWSILPSVTTPVVMYCPGSNGVASPSNLTQK